MKRRIQLTIVFMALCLCASWMLFSTKRNVTAQNKSSLPPSQDAAVAMRNPDMFNWALLLEISKKVPSAPVKLANGKTITPNNALWETWASDTLTFPASPNPTKPPQFPKPGEKPKQLTAISQQQLRSAKGGANKKPLLKMQGGVQEGGGEEVLRNESSFNYIVQNNLWYVEGLKCAFDLGNDSGGSPTGQRPNGRNINFPVDAIEVKAIWIPITEAQKPYFHWNYDDKGNLFGMNALHVMSKVIPNWTWATWEWAGNPQLWSGSSPACSPTTPVTASANCGNPGRCDWIGCRDTFGTSPSYVAPIFNGNGTPPTSNFGTASGQYYAPGTVSPALMKMFQDAGYDKAWADEWQNYRLKGSMVDFTDATGTPNYVGNSITEAGFVQTSSCMTCHVNAAVDASGVFNQSVGFTEQGQSRSGPVNPGWFFDLDTWDDSLLNYQTKYYQIDFVWAIFKAKPAAKGSRIPVCGK